MLEIIGPPKARFFNEGEEVRYRTLAIRGYSAKKLSDEFDKAITAIKRQCSANGGHIYWRRAVALEEETVNYEFTGVLTISCRIATIPDLSQEFWDDLWVGKKEGDVIRVLDAKGE